MAAVAASFYSVKRGIYLRLKSKEFSLYFSEKTKEDEEYDKKARYELTIAISAVYYFLFNTYSEVDKQLAERKVNTHPIISIIRKKFDIPYVFKMIPTKVSWSTLEESATTFSIYGYHDIGMMIVSTLIPRHQQSGKWIESVLLIYCMTLHADLCWNGGKEWIESCNIKQISETLDQFFSLNSDLLQYLIRVNKHAFVYYSWKKNERSNVVCNLEQMYGKIEPVFPTIHFEDSIEK